MANRAQTQDPKDPKPTTLTIKPTPGINYVTLTKGKLKENCKDDSIPRYMQSYNNKIVSLRYKVLRKIENCVYIYIYIYIEKRGGYWNNAKRTGEGQRAEKAESARPEERW